MRVWAAATAAFFTFVCSCSFLGGGEGLRDEPVAADGATPSTATDVEERRPGPGAARDGDCFEAAEDELQRGAESVLAADGFAVAVIGNSLRGSRRIERAETAIVVLNGIDYRAELADPSGPSLLSVRLRLGMVSEGSSVCLTGRASTVGFAFGNGEFERFMADLREKVAADIGKQREMAGPELPATVP